jgi:hypothetical protein
MWVAKAAPGPGQPAAATAEAPAAPEAEASLGQRIKSKLQRLWKRQPAPESGRQ